MKYSLFDERIKLLETYEAASDYRWNKPYEKIKRNCCGYTKKEQKLMRKKDNLV
jgi:hypothetical protein